MATLNRRPQQAKLAEVKKNAIGDPGEWFCLLGYA